jgi:hypothetical protein
VCSAAAAMDTAAAAPSNVEHNTRRVRKLINDPLRIDAINNMRFVAWWHRTHRAARILSPGSSPLPTLEASILRWLSADDAILARFIAIGGTSG